MNHYKKNIFWLLLCVFSICLWQDVFGQSFGPNTNVSSTAAACSSTVRWSSPSRTAITLFNLDTFQQAYFGKIQGVILTAPIIGSESRHKNDQANAANTICKLTASTAGTSNGTWTTDEISRRSSFWSFSLSAYQYYFSSALVSTGGPITSSQVAKLQSYIKRACGIDGNKLADGKIGIQTLNAARICTPPCGGKCGWSLFKLLHGSLYLDKEGSKKLFDNGSFHTQFDPASNTTLYIDLQTLTLVPDGLQSYLKNDTSIKLINDKESSMISERGLGVVQRAESKTKCEGTLTQSQFDFLSNTGIPVWSESLKIKENNNSCCYEVPVGQEFDYVNALSSYGSASGVDVSKLFPCDSPSVPRTYSACLFTGASWTTGYGLTQTGFSIVSSLTLQGGTSVNFKKSGESCCINHTGDLFNSVKSFLSTYTVGATSFAYANWFIHSLQSCTDALVSDSTSPTTSACPMDNLPSSSAIDQESLDEHNLWKQKDSCQCKPWYTKKNRYVDGKSYTLCEKCDIKKCNCWVKLNTNVPFIGRCIMNGETNDPNDPNYTQWDDSVLVVNQLNAFPILMWWIVKILMTVIMLVCFGSLIVAWVMMTIPGQYADWKSLIWKVVYAVALLGVSGVVLYLINPNFFF